MVAILEYYQWLCKRIAIPEPKKYGYGQLCGRLMLAPFKAVVVEDERRIEDVLYMRRSFTRTVNGLDGDKKRDFYRALGPCSVFEIFVVLIEKMSYELIGNPLASSDPASLFFEFIDNLELGYLNDQAFEEDLETTLDEFEGVISVFVNRDYGPNCHGGLFPVETPTCDMSRVDLIQQMDQYLIEKYDLLG